MNFLKFKACGMIFYGGTHARLFLEYARSLPYVKVVGEQKSKTYRLKPEVEAALLLPDNEKGLTEYESLGDMYKKLCLRPLQKEVRYFYYVVGM